MNRLQRKYRNEINEIVAATKRSGEIGYVTSHGGNLSYKMPSGHILITPTKVVKRKITFNDIVIIDGEGNVLYSHNGYSPTGETPMHIGIYKLRPDLNGLVHAHPPYLTGFSMTDNSILEKALLPEPVIEVGPVVSIPYAEPISEELAQQFEKHIHKSNAWLMRNHGITVGSSEGVGRALDVLEMTEMMAISVSVASNLGKVNTIPHDEIVKLDNTIRIRNIPRPGNPEIYTSLKGLYS